jgi:hypothetical protein
MKIIPEIKATFGDTYFLGFTEKKKFDQATNKRTDEVESYICKIASSQLQEQIEVIIPPTVAVHEIKFNQKVVLKEVVIDPYAKSSVGTAFAQVILRCTAQSISTDLAAKEPPMKSEIKPPVSR